MKEAIKMYHLFFPRKWLIALTYIVYPAVIIAISGIGYGMYGVFNTYVVSIMFCVSISIIFEYILDTFMLFGIAAKDNTALEYMKSSAKGVGLLRVGLCMDGVRRVVTTLVPFCVIYLMGRYHFANQATEVTLETMDAELPPPDIMVIVQCVIMVLLFTEGGLVFTRRTKNVLINILMVYVVSAIACALTVTVIQCATLASVLISGIVLAAVMALGRRLLVKRVRGSYYDEGYKAMSQAA